jgi:hypothetical protein
MKELARWNDVSINLAGNWNWLGATIGYTPPVLSKSIEVHGGIFNSWQDTFSGQFKPKIGIGASIKF